VYEKAEAQRVWRKANPQKVAEYNRNSQEARRRSQLRRKFGITPERYDELFEEQGGLCAICSKPEAGRRLAIDHEHATGTVRGLLCFRCNVRLAHLEDVAWRTVAEEYLVTRKGYESVEPTITP